MGTTAFQVVKFYAGNKYLGKVFKKAPPGPGKRKEKEILRNGENNINIHFYYSLPVLRSMNAVCVIFELVS